jgi:hypothetical protein
VPDLSSTLAALGYVKPSSEWSREEIEGYNARVQHYYHEYEQFLDLRTEYLQLVLRSFELKLLLVNAGTLPATGIDVDVRFPKGIVLYEDKKFASEPEVPEPPPFEPFKRDAVIVSDARSPFDLSFLNQHQPRPTWVYPDERRVHFSINELKHNHEAAIDPFKISFATATDIAPFDLSYTVTANEPIDPITGLVRFEIERDES